jgi:hypothetical protein
MYIILAAASLFQLRNLLTTIQALSKLKTSASTQPALAAIFQFCKPGFEIVTLFAEEAFGGANLSHFKSMSLNHYLVLAMVFAVFSLTNFFQSATNFRYRLARAEAEAEVKQKTE